MQRDADAGGDEQLVPFEMQRLRDRVKQLLRDERRVGLRLDVRDQHGEFVAAHARDGVLLAQHGAQPRADDLQQLVAEGVAEGVVDDLEAVEIEEHHRHGMLGAAGVGERHRQPVAEQTPVRQSRQRIVVRLILDLFLGAFALADVARHRHDLDDVVRPGIDDRARRGLEPDARAVLAHGAIAEGERTGRRQRLRRGLHDFGVRVLDQIEHRMPDHLPRLIAEERLDRRRRVEQHAFLAGAGREFSSAPGRSSRRAVCSYRVPRASPELSPRSQGSPYGQRLGS